MADVLDSIQAEAATVVSDLSALQTAVQSVINDLQAMQAGNIPVSDPRFASALNTLQSVDASIAAMTSAANSANAQPQPSPTPTPTPTPPQSNKP